MLGETAFVATKDRSPAQWPCSSWCAKQVARFQCLPLHQLRHRMQPHPEGCLSSARQQGFSRALKNVRVAASTCPATYGLSKIQKSKVGVQARPLREAAEAKSRNPMPPVHIPSGDGLHEKDIGDCTPRGALHRAHTHTHTHARTHARRSGDIRLGPLACSLLISPGLDALVPCFGKSDRLTSKSASLCTWQVRHQASLVISSGHCGELC